MSQAPDPNEVRSHSRRQALARLVGRWRSEGYVVGDPRVPIVGTDTYELLAGGYFLVHHVDVVVGDRAVIAIEIIGEEDAHSGDLLARAYDNDGAVTQMRARIQPDDTWIFVGGADVAAAAQPDDRKASGAVRSTLTIAPDGQSMAARWERSDDGTTWLPWMDMRFTKMG